MFVDSYQVEEKNLSTGKWRVLKRFRLVYKWENVKRRFLCLFRRSHPEITGSKLVQAVIVKVNAYDYARKIEGTRQPRSIRITRVDREASRLVKIVIWIDGKWTE